MLSTALKRAGIVVSAIWLSIGGYFVYLANSHQDFWDNVRRICALDTGDACESITRRGNELFPPEWGDIAITMVGGLGAIWLAIFAIAWIASGKSEDG